MICWLHVPAWPRVQELSKRHRSAAALLVLALSLFVACADASPLEPGTAVANGQPTPLHNFRRLLANSSSSAEQCLKDNAYTVLYSCPGYNGTQSASAAAGVNGTQNMRDAMVRLLQSCVLGSTANSTTNKAVRLLIGASPLVQLISDLAQVYEETTGRLMLMTSDLANVYEETTGIRLELSGPRNVAQFAQARSASIQNPGNESLTHEMWLVTPSAIGDGMRAGAFMDLSDLVLFDQRLQWQGLIPQMRSVGLVYDSKVVSLPLSSYSYQLFYRMDTFKANNWTVPRTWRQLADQAVRMNGTDNMWGFCGAWSACGLLGTNLFKYILASYHQTHGATQGWLLDPDSMRLMLDSPAVAETLDILKLLYQLSPPEPIASLLAAGCPYGQANKDFYSQACHMTIGFGHTYKYASHVTNADNVGGLQGNLGVSFLPGSDRVLDRASHTLVPCDATRCPYATWSNNAADNVGLSSEWVNVSPGFEAILVPINAQASPTLGFYAFSVMSFLSRPEVDEKLMFNPLAGVLLPTRTSQLQPTRWQAAGYNLADSTRYCAAHAAAMSHPNLHVQIRIPGASNFVVLFGALMTSIINGVPTADIAASAQAKGWAILDTMYKGDLAGLRAEYWQSIGKSMPSPLYPSPASGKPPEAQPAEAATSSSNQGHDLMIILSVVIPSVVILAIVFVAVRSHCVRKLASKSTWRKPPGVSPRTTLLVSDIENSTSLWEELDASVMDASAKLHNACLRTLAAKHQGYESVWEGDSFIIAFGDPVDALKFSLAAQQDLMHLDWPTRLLAHPSAAEVWMLRNKKAASAGSDQKGLLFRMSMQKQGARARSSSPAPSVGSSAQDQAEIGLVDPQPSSRSWVILSPETHEEPSANTEPDQRTRSGDEVVTAKGDAWPLKKSFQAKWTARAEGVTCTTDATLAYRGLRVRLGFHAGGLTSSSDLRFNEASRRWVYTGVIRVAANATTSAGLGGHILMSSVTAGLLGRDTNGLLRLLPADCHVFHMGDHMLQDMPQDPVGLLLALPKSLKCRLGLEQPDLRTMQCVGLGALDAPCVAPDHAWGSWPVPVLVGLQVSGLGTLLAWNRQETQQAVGQLVRILGRKLTQWRGLLSEDGLSAAVDAASIPAAADMALAGLNKDSTIPGRVIAAFSSADDAVHWALIVRHCLLLHDWSDELMSHEMCEQVGLMPTHGPLQAVFEEVCTTAKPKVKVASSPLSFTFTRAHGSPLAAARKETGTAVASSRRAPRASFSLSLLQAAPASPTRRAPRAFNTLSQLQAPPTASDHTTGAAAPSATASFTARPEPPTLAQKHALGIGTDRVRLSRTLDGSPAATPVAKDGSSRDALLEQGQVCLGGTAASRARSGEMVAGGGPGKAPAAAHIPAVHTPAGHRAWDGLFGSPSPSVAPPSTRKHVSLSTSTSATVQGEWPSLADSTASTAGIPVCPRTPPGGSKRRVGFARVSRSLDKHDAGSSDQPAANAVFASDAPMLCGLRVRLVVVNGPAVVHVATRSSGRAVYRGGKGVKQLHKLLQQAHGGQVLVAGNVMQDAGHCLAQPQ